MLFIDVNAVASELIKTAGVKVRRRSCLASVTVPALQGAMSPPQWKRLRALLVDSLNPCCVAHPLQKMPTIQLYKNGVKESEHIAAEGAIDALEKASLYCLALSIAGIFCPPDQAACVELHMAVV